VSAAQDEEDKMALPLEMASQKDAEGKDVNHDQMGEVHDAVLEGIREGTSSAVYTNLNSAE
jgi:hypothetical protein